jgi:hypothetical protein
VPTAAFGLGGRRVGFAVESGDDPYALLELRLEIARPSESAETPRLGVARQRACHRGSLSSSMRAPLRGAGQPRAAGGRLASAAVATEIRSQADENGHAGSRCSASRSIPATGIRSGGVHAGPNCADALVANPGAHRWCGHAEHNCCVTNVQKPRFIAYRRTHTQIVVIPPAFCRRFVYRSRAVAMSQVRAARGRGLETLNDGRSLGRRRPAQPPRPAHSSRPQQLSCPRGQASPLPGVPTALVGRAVRDRFSRDVRGTFPRDCP